MANVNGLSTALSGLGSFYGRGVFKVGSNTGSNCGASGGFTGLSAGGGVCIFSAPSDSIAPITTASITSTSTFYGSNINITDSVNGDFASSTSVAYVSINDWLSFSNLLRGIGKLNGGSNFPGSTSRGKCVGGGANCALYDFSLLSTDTVLRNANITGGGTGCPTAATMFTHTWIATSQAACNNVIGATFNGTTCTSTILRNSVELINDGVGNDNGLCEANEDCLLTPNIGSYQGHGNLVSSSTLSGGCPDVTTQGIKLYQYETNGY